MELKKQPLLYIQKYILIESRWIFAPFFCIFYEQIVNEIILLRIILNDFQNPKRALFWISKCSRNCPEDYKYYKFLSALMQNWKIFLVCYLYVINIFEQKILFTTNLTVAFISGPLNLSINIYENRIFSSTDPKFVPHTLKCLRSLPKFCFLTLRITKTQRKHSYHNLWSNARLILNIDYFHM